MDGGITFRDLHHIRVDIMRVGADEAGLSRQRELHVALGQCSLGFLALGDVAGDPKQSQWPAVAHRAQPCLQPRPNVLALHSCGWRRGARRYSAL